MTFLEFHQLVKEDSMIYSWIVKNFSLKRQKLDVGGEIIMKPEEVIIMEDGLLVQESEVGRSDFNRVFINKRIIFTTKGGFSFTALENTSYSIIPTEELFEKLEDQNLLPTFFLQIAEDLEKGLDWQRKLISVTSEERVEMILAKIVEYYQLDSEKKPEFPKWLKIYVLARFAKCSVSTVSIIVNDLVSSGNIDTKGTPWRLTQPYQSNCA
ncbi:Crp/Fnr family transcriptional regulator [Listeria innocua]|uniref:Crp/Fnr family transcriptional regulator n=1 Tax=Listeria innocua TaxID=1642 RepID=UPI00164EAEB6|nr:Crp/Fnr family transcriptional regulator [Listeria innocua]MBC6148610.1 Crp/Fnr family transcriptional regulator [Listeria innocua]